MKRECEVGIGKRAWSAILDIYPDKTNAWIAKTLGTSTVTLWEWTQGKTPSGIFLARLCELGADIEWILTGRSKQK